MAEWLPLYAVFWILRVIEHLHWRPAGSAVFLTSGTRHCRALPSPMGGAQTRGSFVAGNPLDFLGAAFISGTESGGNLDVAPAAERVSTCRRVIAQPMRAECILAVHLYAVVPLVWGLIGIVRSWPYLLGGTVVLQALTVIAFYRAHRTLYSSDRSERWWKVLPLLLAPPAATASHLVLTKELLRDVHPLAAASALCDEDHFRELAIPYLRRSEFPIDGSEALEPRRRAIRGIVADRLGPIEELIAEPARRTEEARSYCPRCLSEYSESVGRCVECPGVELRAFAGRAG